MPPKPLQIRNSTAEVSVTENSSVVEVAID
jgi:hypothetical protein